MLNVISLYIKFSNKQVYTYNIYNLINAKEINVNFLVLKQKLTTSPHKKYITLGNINLHNKLWRISKISIIRIEKSEKILLMMQK